MGVDEVMLFWSHNLDTLTSEKKELLTDLDLEALLLPVLAVATDPLLTPFDLVSCRAYPPEYRCAFVRTEEHRAQVSKPYLTRRPLHGIVSSATNYKEKEQTYFVGCVVSS